MQTIFIDYPPTQTISPLPESMRQVLAIGDFDGVHRGHQEVIGRTVQAARATQCSAAIMTFHPHPREVMGNGVYAKLLTPLQEKQRLMEDLGVNTLYIASFNEQFMQLSPEQFVEQLLVPLSLDTVFVGFDFTFGYRGSGNPDTLCDLAKGRFAVEVVRPFKSDGAKVSSTEVRKRLTAGEPEAAMALLGRPYQIIGKVVEGEGRGRTIGYPTANIEPESNRFVPANGVYAIEAEVLGSSYAGVMNIGVKPTFGSTPSEPVLEAHLFDFHRSIYGEMVTIKFHQFLRGERKFASADALIEQINRDAAKAKEIMNSLQG